MKLPDDVKKKIYDSVGREVGNNMKGIVAGTLEMKAPFIISAFITAAFTIYSLQWFLYSALLVIAFNVVLGAAYLSLMLYLPFLFFKFLRSAGSGRSKFVALKFTVLSFLDNLFELLFPSALVGIIWGWILMRPNEFYLNTEAITFIEGVILMAVSLISFYFSYKRESDRVRREKERVQQIQAQELIAITEAYVNHYFDRT